MIRPTGLEKQIFKIFTTTREYIGTGFSINRPKTILTAGHTVFYHKQVLVQNIFGQSPLIIPSSHIFCHPTSDLAMILVKDTLWSDIDSFSIKESYDICFEKEIFWTAGFTQRDGGRGINLRLLDGNLVRKCGYDRNYYPFFEFEFGSPIYHGQSGSPVFLNSDKNTCIGMLATASLFNDNHQPIRVFGPDLISCFDWIDYMSIEGGKISTFPTQPTLR